jgi:hypothetical protein
MQLNPAPILKKRTKNPAPAQSGAKEAKQNHRGGLQRWFCFS